MNPEREEVVQAWLLKASSDLAYAELGLRAGEAFYAGAVYHCQQAAEKAIKALWCFSGIVPPKSHDLVYLIENLEPSIRLIDLITEAEFLTPMATEFRYPGESNQPSQAATEMAFTYAKRIVSKAEQLISGS